jgi:hypothetical protein
LPNIFQEGADAPGTLHRGSSEAGLVAVTASATEHALESAPERMIQLVRYWEARRQGGSLPTRQDIDALDLKPWLGRLSLHELHDDGAVRCRLRGSHLMVVPGYVTTGRFLNTSRPAAPAALATAHFRAALSTGRPSRHRLELAFAGALHDYDRLTLPLAAGGGLPLMVLTYMELDQRAHDAFWQLYARTLES